MPQLRSESSVVSFKRVHTCLGHSSIRLTFDTYGHLFAAAEDKSVVAEAFEASILRSSCNANDDGALAADMDADVPRILGGGS